MSASTPTLTYACELCGLDGMTEAGMRAHTEMRHLSGRASCPFCDLQDVPSSDLVLHVNQAHLDFLTPELELMTFIDEHSPGYDEDSKGLTDSCSYTTPSSMPNGWHSPDLRSQGGTSSRSPHNGYAKCKLTNGVTTKIKSRENSTEDSSERLVNSQHFDNDTEMKKVTAGAGQGSPLRSALELKLKANTPKKNFPTTQSSIQCLMCEFCSNNPQNLQEHMNRAHFDLTSPSLNSQISNITTQLTNTMMHIKYICPICELEFPNGSEVEMHVNVEHKDILSPQKPERLDNARGGTDADVEMADPSPCTSCPVCSQTFSEQDMALHIDSHFDNGEGSELSRREAERTREEEEFQQLRAQYGMEETELEGGYAGAAASSLRRAVYSGALSVAGYYERSVSLRRADAEGVEDDSSCTRGLLERIAAINSQNPSILQTYLVNSVDHYASTYCDRGWGCGYRNTQMMLSGLRSGFGARWCGGGRSVPSIPRLQQMIEHAWKMGFDVQGSEQLGCKLHNTRKWIGACEVVALLSSLRIRCQLIDFHRPTSPDGSHPALLDWVLNYFRGEQLHKPPLYLQHQGHSRTIIGFERHRDGRNTLLILDPSHAPAQVLQILSPAPNTAKDALQRLVRRWPSALRAKQYQLLAITGVMDSDDEYEARKILQSIRIPQDR